MDMLRSLNITSCTWLTYCFYVAIPLSVDHKPDRSDERERIEKAGGFIVWAGNF